MNKTELKKILKPLIKECIKEAIFEDGTLSTIITEVLKSTSPRQVIQKTIQPRMETAQENKVRQKHKEKQLQENRKKMLDSIGRGAYNGVDLFEGTTPTRSAQGSSSPHGSNPLDGISAQDPGVDISSFGTSGMWKKLAGN